MKGPADLFLMNVKQWREELSLLRDILLDCKLEEAIKWKHPCYMADGKNIAIIHGFKEYCAISFFKGSLLKDPKGLLFTPTENTQSGRQIRFATIEEILKLRTTIKAYIKEAIAIEAQGLKIEYKKSTDFDIPAELTQVFKKDKALEKAFYALTPGRQKGYFLHFAQAKQAETRIARIEKCKSRILCGKGLTDCICGLSKRMPNCDGSHKQLSA